MCVLSPAYVHQNMKLRTQKQLAGGRFGNPGLLCHLNTTLGDEEGCYSEHMDKGHVSSSCGVITPAVTKTGPPRLCDAKQDHVLEPCPGVTEELHRRGFPRHRFESLTHPFVLLLQKRQINIWPRLRDSRISSN